MPFGNFGRTGLSQYRSLGDGIVQGGTTFGGPSYNGQIGPAHALTYQDEGIHDYGLDRQKQRQQYATGVLDRVLPWGQGNGFGSGQTTFSAVGGENTPLPRLPNSFVFDPSMTQGAVNAARAQIDQGTQTQKTQGASDMAARGFSSRSPLAFAMNQAADTSGRTQGTDAERELRLSHAGMNAKQDLAVGGLALQGWQGNNELDVQRRRLQADSAINSQRNLISLLSSLGLG